MLSRAAVALSAQARVSCTAGSVQSDGGEAGGREDVCTQDAVNDSICVSARREQCLAAPVPSPHPLPPFATVSSRVSEQHPSLPASPRSGTLHNRNLICSGSYSNEHEAGRGEQGGKRKERERGGCFLIIPQNTKSF